MKNKSDAMGGRLARGCRLVSLVVLCLAAVAASGASKKPFRFTVLNPESVAGGAGLCVVMEAPNGKTYMYDTANGGEPNAPRNNGRDIVVPWLERHGIREIEGLFISHGHRDHFGGFSWMWDKFPIRQIWDNGFLFPGVKEGEPSYYTMEMGVYRKLRDQWRKTHPDGYRKVVEGETMDWGDGLRAEVLWPPKEYVGPILERVSERDGLEHHLENANAIALRVTYGKVSFFVVGDIQDDYLKTKMIPHIPAEKWRSDICVMPSHGAHTVPEEIEMIRPKVAIAGIGNYPWMIAAGKEARKKYEAAGAEVYISNQQGHITVTTDGETYSVATDPSGLIPEDRVYWSDETKTVGFTPNTLWLDPKAPKAGRTYFAGTHIGRIDYELSPRAGGVRVKLDLPSWQPFPIRIRLPVGKGKGDCRLEDASGCVELSGEEKGWLVVKTRWKKPGEHVFDISWERAADLASSVIHVSASGDDKSAGTAAAPFATVNRAVEAMRELRRTEPARPVRIEVGPGTFEMPETVSLAAADTTAPVSFVGAGAGKTILSGGRRVRDLRVSGDGRFWTAQLPEVKAGALKVEQLYVNGRRAPRPSLPRGGWHVGVDLAPGCTNPVVGRFTARAGQFSADWKDLCKTVEVVQMNGWNVSRLPVKSFDPATREVVLRGGREGYRRTWKDSSVFRLENVRAAYGVVRGEWYCDHETGELSYMPLEGEELASAEVVVPRLPTLFVLKGTRERKVADVTFSGLTLSHAAAVLPEDGTFYRQASYEAGGAVVADYAARVTFEKCAVRHVGGWALKFVTGCEACRVAESALFDLGAGGVQLGAYSAKPGDPRLTHDCAVEDCLVSGYGRVQPGAPGIGILLAGHNAVRRNTIRDGYYSGVSVGYTWDWGNTAAAGNVIENNHIYHLGYGAMSDLAGIYTLGDQPGTVLRGNCIHDVSHGLYGAHGLYFDRGSRGIAVSNNVVVSTQETPLMIADNARDLLVANNVFALKRGSFVTPCRPEDRAENIRVARNVFLRNEGDDAAFSLEAGLSRISFASNVWWCAKDPDKLRFGDGKHPVDRAAWCAAHSGETVADPLVLFASGPYLARAVHTKQLPNEIPAMRLRSASPAWALGFRAFSLEGRVGWAPVEAKNGENAYALAPFTFPQHLTDGHRICGARAEQKNARILWTRVIADDNGKYCGWPTVICRRNGELVAVYSGDRDSHVCPFGKVRLTRSKDGGETWETPRTIRNGIIDDRDSGILELANGDLVAFWFTSIEYYSSTYRTPLHARHFESIAREDMLKALGSFTMRSTDGGQTWGEPVRVPTSTPHGGIQLKDGRLIVVGTVWDALRGVLPHDPEPKRPPETVVAESTDGARSWHRLAEIPAGTFDPKRLCEPTVFEGRDGTLRCLIRNGNGERHLAASESTDGGRTWSAAQETAIDGYPAHVTRLKDGRLLLSYGRRKAGRIGEFAVFSTDEGRTWDLANEVEIARDADKDLGYPSSAELPDGSIVTVYYQHPYAGAPTAVMATKWMPASREAK